MRFSIIPLHDYLRAELLERESAEETREFLKALAEEALERGSQRILIIVNLSRPIFRIEEYGASGYMKELAARPTMRVALLSSRADIRAAHEYIEVLARQQSANVRSFADEAAALRWLRNGAQASAHPSGSKKGAPKRT
jgi:hypothetical protein